MSNEVKKRAVNQLADDLRQMVSAIVDQNVPREFVYERCALVALRIELMIDAAILEEKRPK